MIGTFLHSFMIAKVLGLWMIILSIAMIGKREYFRRVFKHLGDERVADFVFASMLTFLGLVLVCFHNYWTMNLLLLVTIACWMVLLKGLFWLTFPEWSFKFSAKLVDSRWYWVGVLFNFVYGVLLVSYSAYFLRVYEHMPQMPT